MKFKPIYIWSPQKYIDQVENTKNPMLAEYQKVERESITSRITHPYSKTFVDIGAGYGRVLGDLVGIAKRVIAVELDTQMSSELKRRAKSFTNVEVIVGNANKLDRLLDGKNLERPVFLILQNSLGTWKGDWRNVLKQVKRLAQTNQGEVIISVWRQEGFEKFAIDLYSGVNGIVGEPDIDNCDFDRGIFRSKSGFQSQWWMRGQREKMKEILGGRVIEEVEYPAFDIFHIQY